MGFLAFLLVMGIVVTLSDAYCFSEFYKPWYSKKGCLVDGKLYPFGEIEKTENCLRCSCSRKALHCCSILPSRFSYDKDACEVILNMETCDYDVVQKKDSSKKCSGFSAVG
ncbi:beta-microseminoprotein-like isoform X1 [Pogoniulus pusillus]|uniref:beta-microseminoprotein-like isoform X1 n=1 Tax=Pogoniulus pusillus TaxID=488313 RepID=UPI0030B96F84